MATTSRYTLLGTGANFMDFYLPYGDISLDGQEIVFKGGAGVDQVYVGASAGGLTFDFSQALQGVDKMYLSGNWADYTRSFSGSVVTLTRVNGGAEVVKVISGDSIVFANGTVSVLDTLNFLKGTADEPVPSGETSANFPMEVAGPFNNTVRAVVQDSTGETVALTRPGVALVVKGGSGVDVVYVTAGSNVDATQLLQGQDKIYLTGNWADYSATFAGSVVTLTRAVGADTETVKFLGGSATAFDSIVFADGTARSADILSFAKDGTSFSLNVAETTPLPGPSISIATDDSALKSGDVATLTFTLSEASTEFTAADVAVTGGTLSNFSGSGTTYTATFTPDSGSIADATVSVAADTLVNGDGVGSRATTLTMTVDTVVPTLAITSDASALKAAETATITFTFSEAPTGFAAGDVVTTGGTLGDPVVTADPKVYTATFTPTAGFEGNASITVASGAYTDAAGNLGGAGATPAVSIDTLAPTVTLTSAAYNNGALVISGTNLDTLDVVDNTDIKASIDWEKLVWVINGDVNNAGNKTFSAGDIESARVTNATTLTITLGGSAITSLESTAGFGSTGGLDGMDVSAGFLKDAAGNLASTAILSNSAIQTDTIAPTITAQAATAGTNTVTLTMSEAVTGTPAAGDFTVVTNGAANAVTAVSVSGTTVMLTLTNAIPNNATVTVDYTQGADRVSDAVGNALASVGDPLAVSVTGDTVAPTVAGVSSTASDGGYKLGAVIPVTIQFSEAVTVTGTPQLTLETGSVDRTASYASGSGTDTLTFNYTVQAGDTSADLGYPGTSALALNGGTIRDAAGNNATLTLPSPGAAGSLANAKALVVDGVAPTIMAQAATAGSNTVTLTMSETVTGAPAANDFAVVVNSAANAVTAVGVSGTTVTLTLTNAIPNNATVTVDYTQGADRVSDAVGNALPSIGDPVSVTVTNDNTAPTVSGVSSTAADGSYKLGETIPVTIQFSEAVTVTGTPQLTLETGSMDRTVSYASGSGTNTLTFNYTVQAGDTSADLGYPGTSALVLNGGTIRDAAGNNATLTLPSPGAAGSLANAKALVIDGVVPTGTVTSGTYNPATGVLTLTGTNFDTIGAASSTTDIKSQLNWGNLAWDINGDNTTTADKVFSLTDIDSAKVTNANTLTVTLTSTARSALEGMSGFGAAGGADKLDVTAGFIKDAAGNAATTDGLDNGSITNNDGTVPTVASFTSSSSNGTYITGDAINITATMSETVLAGSTFNVTLDTNDVITLTANSTGTKLTGTYTVGAGDSSADLTVSSFSAGTVTDLFGNAMSSTALPAGQNLANNAAIVISAKSIRYSANTFVEAAANDGSIHTTITLTLSGDTFAGTVDQALNGATFSNVPSGLTARLVKKTDTTAELSFTGSAGNHADANDASNFTVTLGNAAFTNGNASGVTNSSATDLKINFADLGLIQNGTAAPNVLNGGSGKEIIYGNGGADVISGGAGSDTIDITDAGTTDASSATIRMTSTANGVDTVIGFKGGSIDSGGDVLDFTGIADLTDSVATGLTATSDFGANNVFVFNSVPVSVSDAAAAIAADSSVVATTGYIVIADSANNGAVTVYHSTDLAADGLETALVILSGVGISALTSANMMV